MRNLSLIKKSKPARLQELEAYENDYNITLPSDYKHFLLESNAIDAAERLTIKGDKKFYMDRFFPFDESHELSLQSTNAILRDFFENRYLTFGCDAGGWQYVISIQKSDYGQVYFCRMDKALEVALTLLADSFEEFIDELQES